MISQTIYQFHYCHQFQKSSKNFFILTASNQPTYNILLWYYLHLPFQEGGGEAGNFGIVFKRGELMKIQIKWGTYI